MPFNVACGFCKNCQAGYTGFCLTVDPGFAGGAYGYALDDQVPQLPVVPLHVGLPGPEAQPFLGCPSPTSTARAEPSFVVSHQLPLNQAPEAYEKFDKRIEGYTQVIL
jgi:threonine dehydrogenase-like Zn-dependent dehydrogenase